MKTKPQNIVEYIAWLCGYALMLGIMSWWTEWIIESFLKKDISFWQLSAFWVLITIIVPMKFKPIFPVCMLIATGYIWFIM